MSRDFNRNLGEFTLGKFLPGILPAITPRREGLQRREKQAFWGGFGFWLGVQGCSIERLRVARESQYERFLQMENRATKRKLRIAMPRK